LIFNAKTQGRKGAKAQRKTGIPPPSNTALENILRGVGQASRLSLTLNIWFGIEFRSHLPH
jgi:hypothetical protein